MDGMRALLANSGKMRCAYCGCPTAAELEHIKPRAGGGKTTIENIALACPYCNRKKGEREAAEFMASGDWRISPPEDLPQDLLEMLGKEFAWQEGDVRTGSKNARVRVGEDVLLMIRPSKKQPWSYLRIGEAADPKTTLPVWDFLVRHQTKKA